MKTLPQANIMELAHYGDIHLDSLLRNFKTNNIYETENIFI